MQLSRRRFLALSATFTVGACSGSDDALTTATTNSTTATTAATTTSTATTTTTTTAPPDSAPDTVAELSLDADPFVFGVASGDPADDSVVLWTRLGGDLPEPSVSVDWTFVGDDGVTLEGVATTSSDLGGAVHVTAEIPGPGTFTFSAGGWTSPTGRTAPVPRSPNEYRIAAASCQHYETGHYAAHRDIAEWNPDLVVFLGDFIYEGDASDDDDTGDVVRRHEGPEPTDLDGYRARYATYLSDPHLQASRAVAPWLTIWDDHEVENNYAGVVSEPDGEADGDAAVFAARRTAAYRAWWENTPTRLPMPELDRDPTAAYPIHRGVDVGELVRISALDGRQFRDDQLSEVILDPGPPVDGWDDDARTMLGAEQELWVADRLTSSTSIWNCLAQQTILGDTRLPSGAILNYDQWDGYHPARERLLADAPANFITLTGDIHLAGVGHLGPVDAPVGVEFVTTAISSVANVDPALADFVLSIPAIVDAELVSRGYTRHTVTPSSWVADYRQVAEIGDPESRVTTWKTFRVDAGRPTVAEV